MQGGNPQPNDCYERADVQIAREKWLPGESVRLSQGRQGSAWSLVERVHAQACSGSIACGGWTSSMRCSNNNNIVCNTNDDCVGGLCQPTGSQTCDTSLNNINCKTLTDKNQCETQGKVSNCALGCNTSAENFCSWGTGGGGGSCPPECRQGSSCGTGYSGASGCSGAGPGGGCKSNQVCCSANSCGGGGGGTTQCVSPVDCPPGTVKSATVTSSACDPVCGNNAWGTGGTPGTAQAYTGCCQYETTGGGNCVWEPCPTKNNPNKVCKVCDPEETWCKKETVTTYECIPSCTTQNPSSVSLVSPANGANIGGGGVTLDWTGVASWGVACDTARQYEVFVDTVPTPTTIYGVVAEGVTSDYFMGTVGQTYYWKIRADNGSVYTDSPVRSFTLVDNQITGTVCDVMCNQQEAL